MARRPDPRRPRGFHPLRAVHDPGHEPLLGGGSRVRDDRGDDWVQPRLPAHARTRVGRRARLRDHGLEPGRRSVLRGCCCGGPRDAGHPLRGVGLAAPTQDCGKARSETGGAPDRAAAQPESACAEAPGGQGTRVEAGPAEAYRCFWPCFRLSARGTAKWVRLASWPSSSAHGLSTSRTASPVVGKWLAASR